MTPDGSGDGPDAKREDAESREAGRAAARDARLAQALRANLKRRKDQARGRGAASTSPGERGGAGAESPED